MNIYRFVLVFLLLFSFNINSAQEVGLTDEDYIVTSSWMVGVGYNFVDDSGGRGKGLFDIKDNWNAVVFPSRLSIGRYFENGLGIEGIATYNKIKVENIINGGLNTVETDYLAFDARLSYDLNKIIGETGFFDPYVGVGLGYADVKDDYMGSYNAVVGFRTWFSDRIGLDLSSTGKFGMADGDGNHLQHAVGVVYQFDVEKGLSKKGMKKVVLRNETQRKTDSIIAAKKAEEEARLLAERLAKEKEQARLAAEAAEVADANTKKEGEDQKRTAIENELKALGNVHFDHNSSYLTKEGKEQLDKLAGIMEANPTLTIKVRAHADARGSDNYNMWLSKRRAKRTIAYLVEENGIDASRLTEESLGNTQLINDIEGRMDGSEDKHSINRRSEFEVISF